MDDALPVDEDLNPVRRHAEEVDRFDDLQALVHQGGGVDRNLRAHVPVGVFEGHFGGDGSEVLPRFAEKGAAGGRQQYFIQVAVPVSFEALENRRMFRVDREDSDPLFGRPGHHQLAARHQRLFVGEGEGDAGVDGGKGRPQADHPHDRVEDDVRPPVPRQLAETGKAGGHPDWEVGDPGAEALVMGGVGDAGDRRAEPADLLFQQGFVLMGREAVDGKAACLADLEGLAADRAGRAQYRDLFGGVIHPENILSLYSQKAPVQVRPGALGSRLNCQNRE